MAVELTLGVFSSKCAAFEFLSGDRSSNVRILISDAQVKHGSQRTASSTESDGTYRYGHRRSRHMRWTGLVRRPLLWTDLGHRLVTCSLHCARN